MKYRHVCLVIGGVSVMLVGQASAQTAASCRKAEFRGSTPVFYYDKACMAKIKASTGKTVKKKVVTKKATTKKTAKVIKPSPKVRSVQRLLAKRGYKPGIADGLMGRNTANAIKAYFKRHGLKRVRGSRTEAVLAHLRKTPATKNTTQVAHKKPAVASSAKVSKAAQAAESRRARVAAIKKAVAAKKAAKAASASSKLASSKNVHGGMKKMSLYERQQKQASKENKTAAATSHSVDVAAKAAAARRARAAEIKKAVAAKRAAKVAAAKKAAKPSFYQRMKKKVTTAVYGKPKAKKVELSLYERQKIQTAKDVKKMAAIPKPVKTMSHAAADTGKAKKAADARRARVAAIKKAVAAKKAAKAVAAKRASTKKVASASIAKPKKSLYERQQALAGKSAATSVAASSNDVSGLQKLLAANGQYNGKVDGKMNIATRKSVIAYYYAHNLDVGSGTIAQAVHKDLKKGGSATASAKPAKVGGEVADLQTALAAKGLYKGKVDGNMNIATRKSVIAYYHAHNLDVGSGTIAQAVHKDLKKGGSATASAKPAKVGGEVADLQTALAAKGLYKGKVDGKMNIATRKSVIAYYHAHNLDVGSGTIAQAVHKDLKKGGTSTASAAPAAKIASSGNKIVDIQTLLSKKGLYSGANNGLLDKPTRASIISYYRKKKIKKIPGQTIIEAVHAHLTGSAV